MYAHWADEPIQALDGKTPRQAIKTPAGLERVKGLLRRYESLRRAVGQQALDFLSDASSLLLPALSGGQGLSPVNLRTPTNKICFCRESWPRENRGAPGGVDSSNSSWLGRYLGAIQPARGVRLLG